jgi:Tol biopolymer transport system component
VLAGLSACSKDRRIVFASKLPLDGSKKPNASYNIWRVNTDGTGLVALTQATANGTDSYDPSWSPDGKAIAFTSSRRTDGSDAPTQNLKPNIWRVNDDASQLSALTTLADGVAYVPQWSRDGSLIAFNVDLRNAFGGANIERISAANWLGPLEPHRRLRRRPRFSAGLVARRKPNRVQ